VVGAGWVAAAVVATGIGLGGIRLVGESLTSTPGGVLSQDQVTQALGEASGEPDEPSLPASPTSAEATESPSPTGPAPVQRSFSSRGGTAIAACRGATAALLSWSPRQGYRVDKAEPGPGDEVEVRFRGGDGRSELKISCSGGAPVADKKED
jgi:hypothetical protein